MIPMQPRQPGCDVVAGSDITKRKVKALAKAAEDCWQAIMARDLSAFAAAYRASFEAQVAMFPGMVSPYTSLAHKAEGKKTVKKNGGGNSIKEFIDKYSALPDVLAWKMPGAGGGGYLACVVEDAEAFCAAHGEAFRLTIRRAGM